MCCRLFTRFVPVFLLCFAASSAGAADVPTEPMVLWPGGAPGAKGKEPTDIPTLTAFLPPKEKATGAAVVVCPGGGYRHLADHEGRPVAEMLNKGGVAGFVLKYRIFPPYGHPAPLLDAQRAIRTVRANAKEWGIDPNRIGILGFSAGGHLASSAATHFDAGKPDADDPIERVSCRPDVAILIYPVITMKKFTHQGSKTALLGKNPPDDLVDLMSNELQVTKETPPSFLVHSVDDRAVPVENSLMFVDALRKVGVAHEMHMFEIGGHGYGLGRDNPMLSSWPDRCLDWLVLHKFAKR